MDRSGGLRWKVVGCLFVPVPHLPTHVNLRAAVAMHRHVSPQQLETMFDDALRHHNAGRLANAEKLYRDILAIDPLHADSLHYLGVMMYYGGSAAVAVDLISQAIRLRKDPPFFFHYNLGLALGRQGRLDDAVASYRRALMIKPDFADAHYNLGLAFNRMGRLDDAAASYRQTLAINPQYADAHNNLGTVLARQYRFAEAVASFKRALAIRQDFLAPERNIGLVREQLCISIASAARNILSSAASWCWTVCRKPGGATGARAPCQEPVSTRHRGAAGNDQRIEMASAPFNDEGG